MKPREYNYIGEPTPKINSSDNMDFIMLLQKSMLLSLVKRGLLTSLQMDCVMSALEKQYQKPKS